MPNPSDLRSLVDGFATELTQVMRRAVLEEVHAKLCLALGDTPPERRGPGRPRKTATAAVPPMKTRGKRSAADLGEMADRLLAHVKAKPGQRGEQIAAALGTDVGTMRLPMKNLIAGRRVRTEGQRRGMVYFAGAGKAKRATRKARRARPARRAKAGKRKRPLARVLLLPGPQPQVGAPATVPAVVEPEPVGAT